MGNLRLSRELPSGCKDTCGVRNENFDRLAAGCLDKQPTGVVKEQAAEVSEKVPNQLQLLSPISCVVTSRRFRDARINQRIDSLPCPAPFLNFSEAASPLHSGTNPRVPRTRISPNNNDRPAQARTTFGLCGWGWRAKESQSAK